MRSARMILATAAASAVLAITAPGAYAADGDWEKGDSSWSKEDSSSAKEDSSSAKEDSSWSKEEDSSHEKEHGKPSGGMHTGGGALTAVRDADKEWSKDDSAKEDGAKEESGAKDESSWSKDDSAKEDSSWSKDDSAKEDSSWSKDDSAKEDSGKDDSSWSGGHEKPSGGMHTGGGALAAPAVTAGGLAVLALAGAGVYTARRKKTVGGLA